jgi:hypothetical protein
MKDLTMDIEWRTVQMFLSPDGVFEVEIDADNSKKVRCSCPTFQRSARCQHAKHVKKYMSENDGHYSISIPETVEDEEAFEAMADPKLFREFVLKHGKVEVIDGLTDD